VMFDTRKTRVIGIPCSEETMITRAFNAVFRKVGRVASSEVVVQLFKSKCLPVMYYGLEAACPVNKSQTKSFQYVVNCCFSKMLNVRSKEDIEVCIQMFNCPSVDLTVAKRKVKLLTKYCHSENSLCSVFRNRARSEQDKIGLNAISY